MKTKDIKDLNLKIEIEKLIDDAKEEHRKAEETLNAFKEGHLTKQEILELVDVNSINFDYEWLTVKGEHKDILDAINDGWIFSYLEHRIIGSSMIESKMIFKREKLYKIKPLEFLTIKAIENLLKQYGLEHNCAVIQALLKNEIDNNTAIKLLQNNCNIPF